MSIDHDMHRSACATAGAIGIEVSDLLMRFPMFNTTENQREFPHELMAVWSALCDARSALLDFEQSIREAHPSPRMIEAHAATMESFEVSHG